MYKSYNSNYKQEQRRISEIAQELFCQGPILRDLTKEDVEELVQIIKAAPDRLKKIKALFKVNKEASIFKVYFYNWDKLIDTKYMYVAPYATTEECLPGWDSYFNVSYKLKNIADIKDTCWMPWPKLDRLKSIYIENLLKILN